MARNAKKIVPKRIGGMKVPKRLRKSLNRALANPKTGEVVSGALLAAAAALAKRGLGRRAEAPGPDQGRDRHDGGARPRRAADRGGAPTGSRSTAEDLGEIGQAVAGVASEAVRGVAASVTRLVGEAVEGLRRDRGPGPDGSASASSTRAANGPANGKSGPAQSEPAEVKTGGGDEFGTRDDNEDPFDGNDHAKPGPMTGLGP